MYEAIFAIDVDLCLKLRDDYGVSFTEPPPSDSQMVTEGGISTPAEALALVEADDPDAANQIDDLIP